VFDVFQALVQRYGLDNISPLGVTMIKFKEPVATDLEGDGSTEMRETSLVDVMEIERELVIHCTLSVVINSSTIMRRSLVSLKSYHILNHKSNA
jgi:hypothetical protein